MNLFPTKFMQNSKPPKAMVTDILNKIQSTLKLAKTFIYLHGHWNKKRQKTDHLHKGLWTWHKILISGERGNCNIVSVLNLNTDRMAP